MSFGLRGGVFVPSIRAGFGSLRAGSSSVEQRAVNAKAESSNLSRLARGESEAWIATEPTGVERSVAARTWLSTVLAILGRGQQATYTCIFWLQKGNFGDLVGMEKSCITMTRTGETTSQGISLCSRVAASMDYCTTLQVGHGWLICPVLSAGSLFGDGRVPNQQRRGMLMRSARTPARAGTIEGFNSRTVRVRRPIGSGHLSPKEEVAGSNPAGPTIEASASGDATCLGSTYYRGFESHRLDFGPLAQLDNAPHYGCGDCEFESREARRRPVVQMDRTPLSEGGDRGFESRSAYNGSMAQLVAQRIPNPPVGRSSRPRPARGVAQSVAHLLREQRAAGSNPVTPT